MSKLPKAREVERVVKKLGFVLSRQSGSHKIYKSKSGNKRITLPFHGGKSISPGVFSQILKDLNMDNENFWQIL